MKMQHDPIKRYGDWCVIYGAAGGMGQAFSRYLASIGFHCILIDKSKDELLQLKKDLEKKFQARIVVYCLDMSNTNELSYLITNKINVNPGLVINCAGFGYTGVMLNKPLDFHLKLVNLLVNATLVLTHLHAQKMYLKGQPGAIINISSANAELNHPIPFSATYSSSKVFVKRFTESYALELKEQTRYLSTECFSWPH